MSEEPGLEGILNCSQTCKLRAVMNVRCSQSRSSDRAFRPQTPCSRSLPVSRYRVLMQLPCMWTVAWTSCKPASVHDLELSAMCRP